MNPALQPLVEMYLANKRILAVCQDRQDQLTNELGRNRTDKQKAEQVLRDLVPLLHQVEGGSDAMGKVAEQLAAEQLGEAPPAPLMVSSSTPASSTSAEPSTPVKTTQKTSAKPAEVSVQK